MQFVIQGGQESIQEVDLKDLIKIAVVKVLKISKFEPDITKWRLRTKDEKQIDMNQSYIQQGVKEPTKFFLTKGPGRGG